MDLHDIREDYCKQALSQHDCDPNPIKQFEKWLNEAITAKVNEPTGVNVATVNEDGRPTSRMVLLKEVNEQGFVFFTNYHSRKGRAIEHNPFVALTFFWPELERSVRIEGKAEKCLDQVSDTYFSSRPYKSKIGARISPQSQVISSRMEIMRAFVKEVFKLAGHEISRPDNWGGFAVTPTRFEFWQGRESRLHDRIQYILQKDGSWKQERLAP